MAGKILIIEDDHVLSKAYELILKNDGYKVETAQDGQKGIEKAEAFEPDIILLDLLMPVMDGLQFLEVYNSSNNHPDVKIIVLSNVGDDERVKQSMQLGAYKYLVKAHASPVQLRRVIESLLPSGGKSKKSKA
jgi:DNA-binding response OmpR family regulator